MIKVALRMLAAASAIPIADITSSRIRNGVIGTMEMNSAIWLVTKCFLLSVSVSRTK